MGNHQASWGVVTPHLLHWEAVRCIQCPRVLCTSKVIPQTTSRTTGGERQYGDTHKKQEYEACGGPWQNVTFARLVNLPATVSA